MTCTQGLRTQLAPVERLRPAPYNPRIMSREEMSNLQRSISRWGIVEPIVVRRKDRTVIGGHQRLEAAKALGMTKVPVVYVDISEQEAKALNVALNKIQGEWDLPKLGELLDELRDLPNLDQTLTGFDGNELDQLLADLERQQQPEPFEESFDLASEMLQSERLRGPTRVKSGEIWQLGRHLMYCGDSLAPGPLERVCGGKKVDLVLTDPPYGIGFQSELARRGRRKQAIANDAKDEYEGFLAKALPAIKAVMKLGAVMYWFAGGGGGEPVLAKALLAVSAHFTLINTLVWDKIDPGLGWRWRRSWEAIIEASNGKPNDWYGGTEKRNVLRYAKAIPQADEHPTPKPVSLLEELIQASAASRALILDPFAGSGSTLIAAERTGRTCLTAELEPRYCDIVVARWEALSEKTASPVADREARRAGVAFNLPVRTR